MKKSSNYSDEFYQVGFAARLLGISEFKLFKKAYHAWHGEKLPDEIAECYFNRYLLEGVVPFWVRNCLRTFLNDPALQKRLDQKRKIAGYCYLVPIAVEYVVIMYFLL